MFPEVPPACVGGGAGIGVEAAVESLNVQVMVSGSVLLNPFVNVTCASMASVVTVLGIPPETPFVINSRLVFVTLTLALYAGVNVYRTLSANDTPYTTAR
jgi:hypothetical protein